MRPLHNSILLLVAQAVLSTSPAAAQPPSDQTADTTTGSRVGFLPLPILFYTPETGIAGGGAVLMTHRADVHDKDARPSSVVVDLIYTQKDQIIAEIYPDIYLQRDRYHIAASALFSKFPLKFYGIGKSTPESFEEGFTSRTFRASLDVLRKIVGAISAGPALVYEKRSLSRLKPNGLLEGGTIPGNEGGRILGAGGVIHWDTRDNIFMPATGHFYVVSLRTTIPGSDYNFSYLNVDLRQYLGITESSTLALQTLADLTSGTVPFYMLAGLGGDNIMRGYYEGRYRDKKLLALQAEYRFPIFWRFGGAAFAGAGDVAPTLDQFTLRTIKASYGLGLRFLFDPVEKMRIRIDFGFGKGSSGLYITANEAF